ncbi:uncharacterized protein PRCAT00002250001 [Priceomyces carsonii]|uniref:uncharacterized protein n=1 Tax=Priceomyces carsonii TaxID=28549 RepID=UPI002ED8AB55|nr:unnamed protein product [Priceomyces carsonii]
MHLLESCRRSSRDVRLLWCSVFIRMGSFGMTNQVLTLYLRNLQIKETKIGLFMTLTLIGDTILSYYLTWHADKLGRRFVMIIGSIMMIASGIIFALCSNFYVLLAAAILGVISPSGDETGPFKSVEEASIAHLTPSIDQPEIFAFHGLFATAGAAFGSLTSGMLVDYLSLQRGWDLNSSYRMIFWVYSALALTKTLIMIFLSSECELSERDEEHERLISEVDGPIEEISEQPSLLKPRFFNLSRKTRHILSRLLVVFMLDSLGYGFMPTAWVVYYFKTYFVVSATALGGLFFLTNAIDAFSSLPSAYLAKKLGPVKAILFTQAPSAFFFAAVAISNNFYVASALLILYYSTTTMDVVPRQFLLTSLIPKNELTKVMGLVNISKTYARCIGPLLTGKLAQVNKMPIGFMLSSTSVLAADIILAVNFLHYDSEIKAKVTST